MLPHSTVSGGLGCAMKLPPGPDGRPAGVFESVLGFQCDGDQSKGLIVGSVSVNGVRLHYEETGQGTETVVFSHSFLLSGEHFAPQIKKLSRHYRCLAFDHRGHGASEAPNSGYDMESLYADAVSFIELVGRSPCHFVGLSTGGFIGLRIGVRRPELVRSLVLMDTSADSELPRNARQYRLMMAVLRFMGYWPLRRRIESTFFGKAFRSDPARRRELKYWRSRVVANDRRAMVRFGRGILERASVYDQLASITLPTLVVVGEEDVPTPVTAASRIARAIPGARLEVIPGAGHVCTVEQPGLVTKVLQGFLDGLGRAQTEPVAG